MECNCVQRSNESPVTLLISIIALIISIVALIISIVAIIIEKQGSRTQLRIDFFNDHFKDVLSNIIPEARQKVQFQNERIVGCEELQGALSKMRKGALYFKYANPKFYKEFVKRNQETEDYFIEG